MYDLPKAAHFDAFYEGQLLPHAGPAGVRVRWLAANSVSVESPNRQACKVIEKLRRKRSV